MSSGRGSLACRPYYVYSGLIFVSDFYTGGVAAEADNCILLEIMIIVISFNDADLLYYLLFDAFARRLRV